MTGEHPNVIERLGEELDRVAVAVLSGQPSRGSRARRGLVGRVGLLVVCVALLVLAAVATAAVLLIREGAPLPAPHAQDLSASGVPLPGSARLAGLDAPDPDSAAPPWDLRLSRTRSGEVCTAVGQVLEGRFGIVGLDHVFRALPLGSVDSCGIDDPDGPTLVGAENFVGHSPAEARTVVSGVAGRGARSVIVHADGGARRLRMGPGGSFITVYAGEAEEVRPLVMIETSNGRQHTIALEQSTAFEVPDPEGGAGWAASTEADLEANASLDEDCVQVTRQPSQSEASRVTLPLTPEVCGRLASSPLIVQMRRFVPGEQSAPFPWGNAPSRTIVYGIATPRVRALSLSGAGATRALTIDRHGGAFMAVLDGHVDPRSLVLTATMQGGAQESYRRPTGLLQYRTNALLGVPAVPSYRAPLPARAALPPPFELPIAASVRETLRSSDPAGGPEWVLRSWQGRPNPSVRGVGGERFICAELAVEWDGQLVEPSARPSAHSQPVSAEGGRCNSARDLTRMRYMLSLESFLDDPYAYDPEPTRSVLSGVLPPGASQAVLLGVGPALPLTLDANNAFLVVLPGRYWNYEPRISYLLGGHRVGKLANPPGRLYVPGTEPPLPQVRAPDPDGGAPWGFTATRGCSTATGRIVAGRLAYIDLSDGVLKAGSESSGGSSSCLNHPEPFERGALAHEPVEFDEQQTDSGANPFDSPSQPLGQPEIERRTLPGRTIIAGIARPDVASVTIDTPSDVRTLRPTGPLHVILAVYAGYFVRGEITATVRLRDGAVESEQVGGLGRGSLEPPTLSQQLASGRLQLAQMHRQSAAGGRRRLAGAIAPMEARLRRIEERLAYERAHPGLLPAE